MRRLFVIHESPWSERARWALDHHGLRYSTVGHLPLLGEWQLRRLLGAKKERITVPVLAADGSAYGDSWEIALYADRTGAGEKLVPSSLEGDVRHWNQVADGGMGGVRARVLARMLENPKSLDAQAPPFVPAWARALLRPTAKWVVRHLQRKYQTRSDEVGSNAMQLRAALDTLRDGLKGNKRYLLGQFSYADIAMATLLQGVLPVSDLFLRLAPAVRDVWTEDAVARDYADLIAWRDDLYERHRKVG
ncbi:glutathione S-transferase N-terminal domain-containing protein [Pendulispora rubella]|uniref:Glutathione S-transferase N-terminal domain-containing protein n=1 Tax=Pendulispora rubella TaxID=2741070 RepID=A0ABZ2L035_9BACT